MYEVINALKWYKLKGKEFVLVLQQRSYALSKHECDGET